MHPTDKNENAYAVLTLIEELTEHEGDSLTIHFPNPDFDGPDYLISHSVEFESSNNYEGNTLLECLQKAKVGER